MDLPAVPRRWPGSIIVILGSGPSLTAEDVHACGGHRQLAINDTYTLAPAADVLFAPDARWWSWHPDALDHPGDKYALQHAKAPGVTRLVPSAADFVSDPTRLATGGHAGYAAINLAVHLGATRIVLLGYDMQPALDGTNHFFGEHPNRTHVRYAQWIDRYAKLPDLLPVGVTVVNASRQTAIRSLPRMSLAAALEGVAA